MQPPVFNFPTSMTPKPKKVRPTLLTVMLGLKGVGDLISLIVNTIAYVAIGSQADVTIPRAQAQRMANVLLVTVVVSFVELFGVVGTFNFKKWGVYIVFGFAAIGIMANLSAGNRWIAIASTATTLLIGASIYPRWTDYD